MPISYSLALAAIAPFCGYLQDLFGRRNITLAGGVVLCVGIIVVATAHSIGAAIGGMAVAGAGAAIGELTALAGLVINLSKFLYHPYC
jgi:MFS family permease